MLATAMRRKGVPVAAVADERDMVFSTVSNSGLKTSAWPMANAKKYSTGRIARSLNADPSCLENVGVVCRLAAFSSLI